MTSMRLMPEEVDALRDPLLRLRMAVDGATEAVQNDDKRLALAYLEIADEQREKLDAIEIRMNEPVPV